MISSPSAHPVDDPEASRRRALWHENAGNLLAGLVLGILLVGFTIIGYQQMRFVAPRFPDERLIETTDENGLIVSPPLATEAPPGSLPLGSLPLRIRVIGAATDAGTVQLAVYGSPVGFNDPQRAVHRESLRITNGVAVAEVPTQGLPEAIAVAAFHDANGDGALNRNPLGIPSERYGFSNEARAMTGPPGFADAAVKGPFGGQSIEITIR